MDCVDQVPGAKNRRVGVGESAEHQDGAAPILERGECPATDGSVCGEPGDAAVSCHTPRGSVEG
jgi:hypothetical protein